MNYSAVDISQGDHSSEPRVSLLPGRRGAAHVLQRGEHLSVPQRLPAAAAGRPHGVMVTQLHHIIIIIIDIDEHS